MPDEPSIAQRPIPERVTGSGARPTAAGLVVVALFLILAALVAKPWSPSPDATAAVGGKLVAESLPPTVKQRAPAPAIPPIVTEGAGPIAPLDWSRISTSLHPIDLAQLGVVTRSADGMLSLFIAPLEPSDGTDVVTTPLSVVGGRDVPSPNAIRLSAAGCVALVLAQPAGHDSGNVLVWRVVPASSIVRVSSRHPVGDVDRNLWIYPPLSAPRGEQRNLGEISASPPTWPPGTYRFDLAYATGAIRHLFVILEPDETG